MYQCDPTITNAKQYLWFLTRDNIVSDNLFNAMMATAKASLPNFDFTKLAARVYQGPKCHYESLRILQ